MTGNLSERGFAPLLPELLDLVAVRCGRNRLLGLIGGQSTAGQPRRHPFQRALVAEVEIARSKVLVEEAAEVPEDLTGQHLGNRPPLLPGEPDGGDDLDTNWPLATRARGSPDCPFEECGRLQAGSRLRRIVRSREP